MHSWPAFTFFFLFYTWPHSVSQTHTHTHTHTHIYSIEFLWKMDRPVAETSTDKTPHTHKIQTSMPRRDSNPQSLQVSGRRHTLKTPRPPGSAQRTLSSKFIWHTYSTLLLSSKHFVLSLAFSFLPAAHPYIDPPVCPSARLSALPSFIFPFTVVNVFYYYLWTAHSVSHLW